MDKRNSNLYYKICELVDFDPTNEELKEIADAVIMDIQKFEKYKQQEAVEVLDDYLNAGSKEERRKASEKAKKVYKDFYGIEFKNRIDR